MPLIFVDPLISVRDIDRELNTVFLEWMLGSEPWYSDMHDKPFTKVAISAVCEHSNPVGDLGPIKAISFRC